MNLYSDIKIRCPFFNEHVCSDKQLKWHISRCRCHELWSQQNPGKQIFRCPLNWQHMFFEQKDYDSHMRPGVCNKEDHNQTLTLFVPVTSPCKDRHSPKNTAGASKIRDQEMLVGKKRLHSQQSNDSPTESHPKIGSDSSHSSLGDFDKENRSGNSTQKRICLSPNDHCKVSTTFARPYSSSSAGQK